MEPYLWNIPEESNCGLCLYSLVGQLCLVVTVPLWIFDAVLRILGQQVFGRILFLHVLFDNPISLRSFHCDPRASVLLFRSD